MSDDWDPRRARAKRPMPVYWDAFHRDTQNLNTIQIGAYFLILSAMWNRPTCNLPNDETQLAQCAKMTKTTFLNKVWRVLSPFFEVSENVIFSKKLQKQAIFVQKNVTKQRTNKTKENPAKFLKYMKLDLTMDQPMDATVVEPGMNLPNIPTTQDKKEKKASPKKRKPLSLFGELPEQEKNAGPDLFDVFWNEAYPHRGGAKRARGTAEKRWATAIQKFDPEMIIAKARAFQNDRKVVDGFAPDPATWLHQKGWQDDIEPATGQHVRPKLPPSQAEEIRRKNLENTARRMIPSGNGWTLFGTFVNQSDIDEITALGLLPENWAE